MFKKFSFSENISNILKLESCMFYTGMLPSTLFCMLVPYTKWE